MRVTDKLDRLESVSLSKSLSMCRSDANVPVVVLEEMLPAYVLTPLSLLVRGKKVESEKVIGGPLTLSRKTGELEILSERPSELTDESSSAIVVSGRVVEWGYVSKRTLGPEEECSNGYFRPSVDAMMLVSTEER
jgi:hypothetical protein